MAVSARSVLGASARTYLLPVAGLLAGAAAAQLLASALASPAAGGNAAGIGGIVGALLAVLAGRRLGARRGGAGHELPRIVGILSAVPVDATPHPGASGPGSTAAR